ncbi:hypothetical protein AGR4C_pb20015 [Agrobacterium tumefaciens str. Kerr 14]|uniref:HTH hxlR-type domain-containing protein n=1 Tax=Agrobacterium tumefaciens str. Kerr 14 TaxID=1183424 RepID=A0A1S7SD75_AGRTU|nr:hypothetical protein AGR4C_pb20015 [Agrobacterium tumefaciens str. Kerr 14]
MATERDWRCHDPKQQLVWAAATRDALKVLEGKWKIVIICQLFGAKGPLRFSELEKRVEGVNQKNADSAAEGTGEGRHYHPHRLCPSTAKSGV